MKSHAYGKGQVIWNLPLNEVLSSMGVERDFVPENIENKDQHFDYIHRATADEDSKWPQRKTRGGGCSSRPTDSKPMADRIPQRSRSTALHHDGHPNRLDRIRRSRGAVLFRLSNLS